MSTGQTAIELSQEELLKQLALNVPPPGWPTTSLYEATHDKKPRQPHNIILGIVFLSAILVLPLLPHGSGLVLPFVLAFAILGYLVSRRAFRRKARSGSMHELLAPLGLEVLSRPGFSFWEMPIRGERHGRQIGIQVRGKTEGFLPSAAKGSYFWLTGLVCSDESSRLSIHEQVDFTMVDALSDSKTETAFPSVLKSRFENHDWTEVKVYVASTGVTVWRKIQRFPNQKKEVENMLAIYSWVDLSLVEAIADYYAESSRPST